ncbi:MAG: fused MFS/spermidine synthase [Bryobacterales bacterium]|nr:fused MFS/spermidine synthase [Bryobacterales bacterium]
MDTVTDTGTDATAVLDGVSRWWLWLDAFVVFLGAFLLFLIQPAYSKFILPWFGGVPLVWATALVFFQCALLAGYAYAHLLNRRLAPRYQLGLHCLLLLVSLTFLPVMPGEQWKPSGGDAPGWRILAMLVVTLGMPYMLLAATSPLVQAWIARYRRQIVPYRLFSLSNLASLLGLLSYPFLIEPAIGLELQFTVWSRAYGLYAVAMALLMGVTAVAVRKQAASGIAADTSHEDLAEEQERPAWQTQALWVALAACPSMLFLATTQHLTLDVAPVPFLWVLPLVLYLLTFVICFEFPHFLPQRLLGFLSSAAATLVGLLVAMPYLVPDFRLEIVALCGGLFVMMLFCHAELYDRRPVPRHLTRFYLMTALGGALGGSFVGLVAHRIFHGHYEIYVGLGLCTALVLLVEWPRRDRRQGDFEVTFSLAAPLFATALVITLPFLSANRSQMRAERNFFGALRVVEGSEHGLPAWRQLDHGTTKHGVQLLAPSRKCQAVAYYSNDSGVGRLMAVLQERHPALRVGVIGLGIGTLAAYARPADEFVFYEINPLIERIAREDFSFLSECAQHVQVRLGDARVQMESEAPNAYSVLFVDAFSGDSIPTHLLTREAFAVYTRHLAANGVMLVNISNRYLDLRPVVRASAASAGFDVVFLGSQRGADDQVFDAVWALLARDPAIISDVSIRVAAGRTPQPKEEVLWTDDFSNLFRVMEK